MRVLLVSTYELGHQPLHAASPAAALTAGGHEVRVVDTSVDPWDGDALAWAEAVALSVPMHTAMRIALRVAQAVRSARPDVPVCLYGLYATVGSGTTLAGLADRVIAGEYEPQLVAWVDGLAASAPQAEPVSVELNRSRFSAPDRRGLPGLDRYARLAVGDELRLAGYTEASHGCVHRCRHCPVPVIYDGRIRVVDEAVVLADIEAQVAAGARHVTFGDPDFLNGPAHSLRVVRELRRRFPDITFDCTTKVSHILRHAGLWGELADCGCLFVVSAFEAVDDRTLALLDKGHTTADAVAAVELLRRHGIEIRPSFLPFTPWTEMSHLVDLVDFVAVHDLVTNVDPVQYTIRLLIPPGSLLLDEPALAPHLGDYDPDRLSWTWTSADAAVDRLQAELATLVEQSLHAEEPLEVTYRRIRAATLAAADLPQTAAELTPLASGDARPRLTEPWFC